METEVVWVRLRDGTIVPRAPHELISLTHNQYDFTTPNWTVQTFSAWLGGFLDRAAKLRRSRRSLQLEAWSKDGSVLYAIEHRLRVGAVEQAIRGNRWFVWRVKADADVVQVLRQVQPYLTTLFDAAVDALEGRGDRITTTGDRDREILARWLGGRTYRDIARLLKVSPSVIARVIDDYRVQNGITPLRRKNKKPTS